MNHISSFLEIKRLLQSRIDFVIEYVENDFSHLSFKLSWTSFRGNDLLCSSTCFFRDLLEGSVLVYAIVCDDVDSYPGGMCLSEVLFTDVLVC